MTEDNQKLVRATACGSEIRDHEQYPSAMYHGETVYFCTQACLKAFNLDPDPFMAGEIEHPSEDN